MQSLQKRFPHQHALIISVGFCTVSAAYHCVTGIFAIQVQRSQMLPSPPVQCVACLTVGSWGLQFPGWFFLWCSHLSCCIKARGQVCLPPESIWITLWLGICTAGRRISEVRGLLPEISSGGCLKTFSIHWITPVLQDDTDNRGNY